MKRKIIFILSVFFSFQVFAQNVRYCDTELKIAYPDSGHYFISPGVDSVGYWIINHGPDTVLADDFYWLRMRLSSTYLDPQTIVKLGRDIIPGDSLRFSTSIDLKFFNHRPSIDFCFWLRVNSPTTNTVNPLYNEEDSALMFENNHLCMKVAHDRREDVSIKEVHHQDVSVYPNPFTTHFNIKSEKSINVKIYNIMGKLIYSGNGQQIETNSWKNGMYFAQIQTNEGEIIHQKLIKIE